MFKYFAEVREAVYRGSLLKERALLARAKAEAEYHRAAALGSVIVPAGHALVRPSWHDTTIDQVPYMIDPNRARGIAPPAEAVTSSTPVDPSSTSVDIITEARHLGRAYAFLGGQQLGKTWGARHIAADWARRERDVWFIGPKWCHGEWGPTVRMWGPDWDAIESGLITVAKEAKARRETAIREGLRTQDAPPRLVVIDDWTEVANTLGELAQRFVVSATTMFASVNLIPLFCGHSNTSAAWGTDRIGAALTENFLKIRVHRGKDGKRIYGVLYPTELPRRVNGELVYPQYGRLPAGDPIWPSKGDAVRGRSEGTRTGDAPQNPPFYPVIDVQSTVQSTTIPRVRPLHRPPPREVEVLTNKGNWKRFMLPPECAVTVRRAWEERPSLNHVIAASFLGAMPGHRVTKTNVARAILGLPSQNYRVIQW